MNIQELNGNGRNIKVFVLTALVALLVTGGSWLLIEIINASTTWGQRQLLNDNLADKPSFSIGLRLIMLSWLVWNRHVRWLWKSGALHCILTNDRHGPIRMPRALRWETGGQISTGDYILYYSRSHYQGRNLGHDEDHAFDYSIWVLDDDHDIWNFSMSLMEIGGHSSQSSRSPRIMDL